MEKVKEHLSKWSEQLLPWLLTHGLKIILITLGAYIFYKVARVFIEKGIRVAVVRSHFSSAAAEKKREDTLIRIFMTTLRVVLIILVILMALQESGVKIGPILAGAGIVGLAFGFGG